MDAGGIMAELGEDKEVGELLFKKMREKGFLGKLFTTVS